MGLKKLFALLTPEKMPKDEQPKARNTLKHTMSMRPSGTRTISSSTRNLRYFPQSGSAKGVGSVLLAWHKQHTEALVWATEIRSGSPAVGAVLASGPASLLELEPLLGCWTPCPWQTLAGSRKQGGPLSSRKAVASSLAESQAQILSRKTAAGESISDCRLSCEVRRAQSLP